MSNKEKCKSGCLWAWSTFITAVFEYDTAKIVHIKNKKVGVMNRIIQLGIILYIIVYGIIIQKGYQKTGNVVGIVTTKMKGAYEFEDVDKKFMDGCDDYFKSDFLVFDPADYVIPPQEPDSFFVMTNMWITCGQRYGICPESPDVSHCTSDADCPEGHIPVGGNGPNNGTCNNATNTCDIRAWCPTEHEDTSITHNEALINAYNFTVLIKNSIRYPHLLGDERKRNLLPGDSRDYLKNCTFDPSHHNGLYCPIMSLGYIVDNIHHGNFTDLSIFGGVVGIEILWNCDLDFYGLDRCDPKYTFRRLDDPYVGVSKGYNFRFARYFVEDGMQTRNLYKAYGILFKVVTIGKGGKFDFTTLFLKIGSMIALLGIGVVISDVIVLYVLKKRNYYKENKYQEVKDSDVEFDYEVVTNPPDADTDHHHGPPTRSTPPPSKDAENPINDSASSNSDDYIQSNKL